MRALVIVSVGLGLVAVMVGSARADEAAVCDPSCANDTTLSFCDGEGPVSLECGTLSEGARCALLSPEWGADCVLPAAAPCDPRYAFGLSRCDPTANLFCLGSTCTTSDDPPSSPGPAKPTAGTATDTGAATSPFACSGCDGGGAQTASLLGVFALWTRRKRGARR